MATCTNFLRGVEMITKQKKPKTTTELYEGIFPTHLREVMEAKNITQSMLAAEIGVSRQSVAKYTAGLAQPNIEALQKIVTYLQVSGDYLIGVSNSPPLNPDMNNACKYTGLSEQAIKAIRALDTGDGRKPHLEIFNMFCEDGFMEFIVNAFREFALFTSTGKLTFSYTGNKHKTVPIDPKIIAEWFLGMELDRLVETIKNTMLEKYSHIYNKEG
jgi:transcriptional regulator with XRE-family HTH domain